MTKVCKTCGAEKTTDQFSVNRAARDGRINSCKPCETKRVRAWSDANPEKKKAWSEKNSSANLRANLSPETMFVCTKCKTSKSVDNFGKNCRNKNNIRVTCKECVAAHMARKYADNPGPYRQKTAKWRDDNPIRAKEYSVAYVAANRAERNEHRRLFRLANIEREKSRDKEYTKNNRAKVYAKNARRRASETQATPKWLTLIQQAQINEFYELALAKNMQTGIDHDVDHIIPLRGTGVRGLHVPWNLQILTEAENSRKYNKIVSHYGST